MKYLLKHPSGEYLMILSEGISLEEFKERVKNDREILKLYNLDGSYSGAADPAFLDQCEIIPA